jgi:hypothetical protein
VGTSALGVSQAQNWRQEDATDRTDGVSSRKTAAGTTTTIAYTESLSSSWALGAVALKAAGPPADTTGPTITSVSALNGTSVQVVFSEPVGSASAQTPGNYSLNQGVTVYSAVLEADGRTVTLTTSALATGNYLLTVNNVTDQASPANVIAPNSQGGFSYTFSGDPTPSSILFQGSASGVDVDGNNSASLTFGQGALSEGYIVVGVSMYDAVASASITGVTYGGTPMGLLGTRQDANAWSEVYLFGLAVGNRAAGNYNVVVSGSTGIDQVVFGVSAFSGVNQSTPAGAFASATASSATASVTVSSGAGDLVVDILAQDVGTSALGVSQAQNWRQEDATDRTDGVSSHKTAAGTTTTISYTESLSSSWALGAVALRAAGP